MTNKTFVDKEIYNYALKHTLSAPPNTKLAYNYAINESNAPQMVSDPIQGRFLKLLTNATKATKVLEIGTFTGFSALCFAEALPHEGFVTTLELNTEALRVAIEYFKKSPHGHKIKPIQGYATEILKNIHETYDIIYIDADKKNYPLYYELSFKLLKNNGLFLIDNSFRAGEVLNPCNEGSIAINNLNKIILDDKRVENAMLTIRDGLNIVRKISD